MPLIQQENLLLSVFLQSAGASIIATDDDSWTHVIDCPGGVTQQNAVGGPCGGTRRTSSSAHVGGMQRLRAARIHDGELCRARQPTPVRVVNWNFNVAETALEHDHALSRQVLPCELKSGLWVFRRTVFAS